MARERIIDSPISEAGITGLGVGAAMTGMRPVVDIMFGDFLGLIMDQIANQAAKIHYMSGGKLKVPMVLRTTLGATRRSAAQHSQSLHAWVSHIPGLKVALPSTPYDAKGPAEDGDPRRQPGRLLRGQDDVPAIKGPVPEEEYTIPFGVADIKRAGDRHHDCGDQQHGAGRARSGDMLAAARHQRRGGRSAHARSRSISRALIDSAKKTSRAIVVDEGYERYGVTAELAAVIADGAFYYLDAPVKRMGAMDVPMPFSPVLEDQTVPTADAVAQATEDAVRTSTVA